MRYSLGLLTLIAFAIQSAASMARDTSVSFESVKASVYWNGLQIIDAARGFRDSQWKDVSLADPPPPLTKCKFAKWETQCWKVREHSKSPGGGAGTSLLFAKPIPVLPIMYPEGGVGAKTQMPEYTGLKLNDTRVKHALDNYIWIGTETDSTAYVPIEKTTDGQYTLDLWRSFINKLPKSECVCGVVLKSTFKGHTAISYCGIDNSPLVPGMPFNCQIVAYEKSGQWLVLSYDGPKDCGDGCGAFDEDTCGFQSTKSLEEVEKVFIEEMGKGITKIELKETNKGDSKDGKFVELRGSKTIADSGWEKGKYENADAHYTLSKMAQSDSVSISGTYYLMVSVEPTKVSQTWHDVGDLRFFHERIQNIIRTRVAGQLSTGASYPITFGWES